MTIDRDAKLLIGFLIESEVTEVCSTYSHYVQQIDEPNSYKCFATTAISIGGKLLNFGNWLLFGGNS